MIDDVRKRDEETVREYSERSDAWTPDTFRLAQENVDPISVEDVRAHLCAGHEIQWAHAGALVPR